MPEDRGTHGTIFLLSVSCHYYYYNFIDKLFAALKFIIQLVDNAFLDGSHKQPVLSACSFLL